VERSRNAASPILLIEGGMPIADRRRATRPEARLRGTMATDGRAGGERADRATRARSRLFTVRLWKEAADAGPEYRGSVRDVVSGAFRNFRDWSDLTAFMVARVEEDENALPMHPEGGRDGDADRDD
jgi:hypothetical protein